MKSLVDQKEAVRKMTEGEHKIDWSDKEVSPCYNLKMEEDSRTSLKRFQVAKSLVFD